jgi:hypothetical protein
MIHQASSPSNGASPELYAANFDQFGGNDQVAVPRAAPLLDDGWRNAIDELRIGQPHDLTQFIDDAGLQFSEHGSTLISPSTSSPTEICPKR